MFGKYKVIGIVLIGIKMFKEIDMLVPQQLQTQKGEHKSMSKGCELSSLLTNSCLFIHESE